MNDVDTRRAAYIDAWWQAITVPALMDYIRIPNKSPAFDPDWAAKGHMQQAATLLQATADAAADEPSSASRIEGFRSELFSLPGRTPTLVCEIPAFNGGSGRTLLYGHYDKQPEFDGWRADLSPFEPKLEDGKLYGRGGADDGYALFGVLAAIAALQAEGTPHGDCLVLIEGSEESGSIDLPFYVEALAARIGTPDLVVCLDAECGNYDQLWTTTSLRGMLPGTLAVNVLTEGQHSGAAGGIVPSSFRVLRHLIERVECSADGRLIDALTVPVPVEARQDAERAAAVLGASVVERFPFAGGTQPEVADPTDAILRNTWQPSLATVGLAGAPALRDAGNTLRPGTAARLVFRLPPTLDAGDAAETVRATLERNPPYGAEVRFEVDAPQTGWCAPPLAPWLARSLDAASRAAFGRPGLRLGMGGTIPFMKMLGDRYPGVQFFVTGVLGPLSNAHGPNEFLHLATGRRVSHAVAHVLADLASVSGDGER